MWLHKKLKPMDQPVQLTKSIKSVSPKMKNLNLVNEIFMDY